MDKLRTVQDRLGEDRAELLQAGEALAGASAHTFVARDIVQAGRVLAVPRDEALEDEVVGDKLVGPVVVRAARGEGAH